MASRQVAMVLAVWLTLAAVLATAFSFPANALPNHVVAGGVFGPGGSVDPAPSNPANAAGFVFYSTSQPSFSLLVGADSYISADGANPALFAKDVGAAWNWTAGDETVVVVETVRGVGGWAGVNYTTSLDAPLSVGGSVQDFGDGTLEALPVLALVAGPTFANVSWTGLTDVNGNVVSYEVYQGPGPMGPFTSVSTVAHQATSWYNGTSLTPGQYCYNVAVNYRRDDVGGVYETTGRSETTCGLVTGVPPSILSTSPVDGASGVASAADIVVTFSEPMDTPTVTWSISPIVALTPAWTVGNTVLTLSHAAPFIDCTTFTVQITGGRDPDGNALVAGPVPNPWSFTSTCPSPYVVSTSPADGAVEVRRDAPIVITFSEAMNTATVVVTFTPTVSANPCQWTAGDTVCTVTHNGLTGGIIYQVGVTGQDPDGNALVAGPVPNPWSFTVNSPPSALLTAPPVGVCRTGGYSLDISWTMGDTETAVGSLLVWLNYTDGITTSPITGPLTGLASPATFSWVTPTIDADIQVLLVVVDGVGESANDLSPLVTIDSTAPTVSLTQPASGSTGVATDSTVVLSFSEPMDRASTEAAFSFNPTVAGVTFTWSDGDSTLTVGHQVFQADTLYTLTVGTGAKDACDPGSPLAADFTASFTTGAGTKAPNPPTNLRPTSQTTTAIALAWDAPTEYTDGSALPESEIAGYDVYRSTTATGTKTRIAAATSKTYTDTNVQSGAQYFYWVTATDFQGRESDFSAVASARAGTAGEPGLNPLVILIPLIVILLLIGAFLLMRRKKPEPGAKRPPTPVEPEEVPAEEAYEEAVVGEEAAPEEAPEAPAEEGGEQFMPCPNCGTMVKPTDAECFVCGAKL